MSGHEELKHEDLAAMVARADPGAVEARARVLMEMVPLIREVGDLIAARVASMEWSGEAAEVVRAWGDHFRQESAVLGDYAEQVGGAMQVAAQVLAKVKAAMPPTRPSPLGPLSEAMPFEQTMAEVDRQEAIQLIDSLDSAYRVAGDAMSRAPEPRFEHFSDLGHYIRPPEGAPSPSVPFGAPASVHSGSPSVYAAPTSGEGVSGVSAMSPSAPGGRGEFVSGATTPGGVASGDERIGTSLDSVTYAPDTRGPTAPVGPPSPGPAVPPGGAENMQMPAVNPQPRGGPWLRSGPADGGVPRTPQPSTQQPAYRPAVNPMSGPDPATAHSSGHHVGNGGGSQGSMIGRPPIGGFPGSRTPWGTDHSGIIGGVPRQLESYRAGVPQNGIVGSGVPQAFRDPTTGAVRGPGGALVGSSASRPTDVSRSHSSKAGDEQTSPPRRGAGGVSSVAAGITGRPAPGANGRPRKRRRNDREQQEKDR